jgi:hypothetical protein
MKSADNSFDKHRAQGRFFIGFYHQWNAFFEKPELATEAAAETGDEEK